jgi:hypothetical protein
MVRGSNFIEHKQHQLYQLEHHAGTAGIHTVDKIVILTYKYSQQMNTLTKTPARERQLLQNNLSPPSSRGASSDDGEKGAMLC